MTPFTVTRIFNAPRDVVWKAWTEREALEEWWGPKGCAIEVETLDASSGGTFHYSMRMPDGQIWWGIFHYEELGEARTYRVREFVLERCGRGDPRTVQRKLAQADPQRCHVP
ncbi:activator of Hsp90 ATPase 1 family protein [Afipia carboxidovorans OM5]|nr:activator of Hsp90 ATPase 1 family protein [Afipia carboxidovorans OM5]